VSSAEGNLLHGLPEVRGAWHDGNDAAVVHILAAVELDRSVVDGVELEAEDAHGHLPRETARQVVDEQLDVHFGGDRPTPVRRWVRRR